MKHILETIIHLITMIIKYISVILILVFDSVIFGAFVMLINNYILLKLYGVPEITYIDAVGLLFLVKIISLMVKSINIKGQNDTLSEIN